MALLCASAQAETTVFKHARVYTLDPKHPWLSTLMIRDGRIVDGPVPKDARIIDLHGRMVLPGFHDAHTHPMSAGMRLLRCKLDGTDIEAQVRACAATQKGPWLLGAGWPESLHPTTAQLDALVPDRPAFLTTQNGFIGWANSKALALAGVAATGALSPELAQRVRHVIPPPSEAEYREALRRASSIANRFGITSVFDAAATPNMLDAYHDADLAGELTLRVVAAQRVDLSQGPEQVDAMVARRDRVAGRYFRADAAKFFLDEEITLHTAAMLAPYADAPASGALFFAQPKLDALVERLDAEGFLIHMHAMGDAAVREGLDALAHTTGGRHQIAHLGTVDAADIPRFGRLGVTANFSPLWAMPSDPDYDATRTALGPKRSFYPIARIAASGARITAGSDWNSTSMNPLDSIQAAVTRPDQRMTLAAMLAAYTKDAAWAAREDALDGTLEAGKAADLIVLSRDLFKTKPLALSKVRVLLTLLDGKPVYRDPSFSW
ncbi:MAG TPA: amidohydrolase [Rhizomicrobium sp.]|nr:amidohydrolase [Rhizomicrobium sp.]